MFDEMDANCSGVLVARPNSRLKEARASDVPIKAES